MGDDEYGDDFEADTPVKPAANNAEHDEDDYGGDDFEAHDDGGGDDEDEDYGAEDFETDAAPQNDDAEHDVPKPALGIEALASVMASPGGVSDAGPPSDDAADAAATGGPAASPQVAAKAPPAAAVAPAPPPPPAPVPAPAVTELDFLVAQLVCDYVAPADAAAAPPPPPPPPAPAPAAKRPPTRIAPVAADDKAGVDAAFERMYASFAAQLPMWQPPRHCVQSQRDHELHVSLRKSLVAVFNDAHCLDLIKADTMARFGL